MAERPLILFGQPTLLEKEKKHGGVPRFQKPTYSRQIARMTPKFEALQTALDRGNIIVTTSATTIDPEYTLVFETVGDPSSFFTAVKRLKKDYPNVEWIAELSDSSPNSEDFYVLNNTNERDDTKELSSEISENQVRWATERLARNGKSRSKWLDELLGGDE